MFRNASQLQFGFIHIFFSPGLKGWYDLFFFFFKENFYGYELAILKIFKCNALVWTSLFMCFLCTTQKIPTLSNFSCKDFGSSLLAENITPSNFSSLLSPLGGASMNSGVCCKVGIFFFFFTWYASN